jgi:hypothetical protein
LQAECRAARAAIFVYHRLASLILLANAILPTEAREGTLGRLGRGLRRHPWLLIEAGVFAMLVEVRLRVLAIQRVLSRFSAGDAQPPIPDCAPSPATVTRAIETVYRLLPLERTCLKHALIFCHIYRRRGLPAVLRIGVQQNEGFAAHAWVEDGSGALLTDPLEDFVAVPLPPPVRRARDE